MGDVVGDKRALMLETVWLNTSQGWAVSVLIIEDWRNGNADGFDPYMRRFDPFILFQVRHHE
jgi:hypothetical protein